MRTHLKEGAVYRAIKEVKGNRVNSVDNPPHHMSAGLLDSSRPRKLHLAVNHLPGIFRQAGMHGFTHVGHSSGTLHAEATNYRDARGDTQFVSVDPCTNCVKDGIVFGVQTMFIDSDTMNSHYRKNHARKSAGGAQEFQFDKLGLPLYAQYGVDVFMVSPRDKRKGRRESKIVSLHQGTERIYPKYQFVPETHHPRGLEHHMNELTRIAPDADWAIVPVITKEGQAGYLIAFEALPPDGSAPKTSGKFSQVIDAPCVAFMTARRLDMTIVDGAMGSNFPLYPRQLFTAIAFGITQYFYVTPEASLRSGDRLEAMQFLQERRVANFVRIGKSLAYAA